jgi:hypothetical protein
MLQGERGVKRVMSSSMILSRTVNVQPMKGDYMDDVPKEERVSGVVCLLRRLCSRVRQVCVLFLWAGRLISAKLAALERLAQLEEVWLHALHESAAIVRATLLLPPELMNVPLLESSLKTVTELWKAACAEKSILATSLLDVWTAFVWRCVLWVVICALCGVPAHG